MTPTFRAVTVMYLAVQQIYKLWILNVWMIQGRRSMATYEDQLHGKQERRFQDWTYLSVSARRPLSQDGFCVPLVNEFRHRQQRPENV